MSRSIESLLVESGAQLPSPSTESTARARSEFIRATALRGSRRRSGGRPRYRLAGVAAAGLAVIALGAWVVLSSVGGPGDGAATTDSVDRGLGPGFSVGAPLRGGQRVSLTAAAADIGQQLPLPSVALASQASMGTVTESRTIRDSGTTDTLVAVSYPGSSLVVEYESPVPYADPAASYQAYVAETPSNLSGLASVGKVGDRPALVIQQGKDAIGSNPASVEFVANGLRIAVIGYQPASALLPVAESINPDVSP